MGHYTIAIKDPFDKIRNKSGNSVTFLYILVTKIERIVGSNSTVIQNKTSFLGIFNKIKSLKLKIISNSTTKNAENIFCF